MWKMRTSNSIRMIQKLKIDRIWSNSRYYRFRGNRVDLPRKNGFSTSWYKKQDTTHWLEERDSTSTRWHSTKIFIAKTKIRTFFLRTPYSEVSLSWLWFGPHISTAWSSNSCTPFSTKFEGKFFLVNEIRKLVEWRMRGRRDGGWTILTCRPWLV